MEAMPEDQTPALIIMNGGLEDEPLKRGTIRPGKSYYACYKYRIGCLASAKGKKIKAAPRANKVAKMYATAVRSILIQKRDDRGVLGMIDWVDDMPGPLDSEDDRTIAMWVVEFNVEVPNTAAWATGPTEPDELPDGAPDPPVLGTVETIDVTIDKVPNEVPFDEYVPPEPPEPPQPPAWVPIGDWVFRPQQDRDNMFPGDLRMNWDTPQASDILWVHKQDAIMNDDHSAELNAITVGDQVRIDYPGASNSLAGATWDAVAPAYDGADYVELTVHNTEVHGTLEDHFGEGIQLSVLKGV